jgi:hypothetical protein
MSILNKIRSRGLLPLLVIAALLVTSFGMASAATLVIVNNDGAGEGFNDASPRAPVGGNPMVTLGTQRLYIFQYAANIWGSILPSNVTIQVRSQFNPLTCNATSAVLGSAGPVTIHANFAGAPFNGYWYHQSLANRLAGFDLDGANPDINATFNSTLDGGTCLGGAVWYYGVDGNEGTNVELLPVILHEMGHGLNFSTTTSGSSGNFNTGLPAIWDKFLMDSTNGLHWDVMSPAQRVASAISIDKLVWDGPSVTNGATTYLGNRPMLKINSPAGIAGTYAAGQASFGAALTLAGVTGNVVLMDDATGPNVNDGCEALVNGGAIAGNIALVDRGTCTFVIKAQAAQAAGAIGLLIANNVAGIQPPGGTDPSITIPVIGITQADGNAIKANLGGGVNVTIGLNPALKAGADAAGHVQMYAPNPFASGSSVSHYDVTLSPNALMEPAINNDLHDTVDLTLNLFKDIGWFQGVIATTLSDFNAEGREDGVLLSWRFADPADVTGVVVERAATAEGPWTRPVIDVQRDGALDANAEPGVLYFYRLSVTDREGQTTAMGLVSGQRIGSNLGRFTMGPAVPNPTTNVSTVSFRITQPEFVRLQVVDVKGQRVRTIQQGMMLAGQYSKVWDGKNDHGQQMPAGVYFLNLRTSQGEKTQRVTVVR